MVYGSNKFIDSAEKIGLSLGISSFVIGVTLVAFGTSLPELATSIVSVLKGSSEIVIGNVVGSNITNILLVIGLSAMSVRTLVIKRNIMDTDIPLLMGSAILLWFVLRDLEFSFFESMIFISGMIGFLFYTTQNKEEKQPEKIPTSYRTYITLFISGICVYFGAIYTVDSLINISELLGIDSTIVSLGALALGTSLPEVVVSIAAARRGMHEMAVGNVIGSNIFNTYAVLAIPSFFGTLEIAPSILDFSLPFMVAVTAMFGLISYSKKISFWEAGMLISFYIFFLAELIRTSGVN